MPTLSISTGLAIVIFLLGLGLSLGATEVLVNGLGRLGGKLGLAAGLLGLLVALGADAPEISSAITALLSGAKDVGVGVILRRCPGGRAQRHVAMRSSSYCSARATALATPRGRPARTQRT